MFTPTLNQKTVETRNIQNSDKWKITTLKKEYEDTSSPPWNQSATIAYKIKPIISTKCPFSSYEEFKEVENEKALIKRKFEPHIAIESKLKFGLPIFSTPTSNPPSEKFKLEPKKEDLESLTHSIEIFQNKIEPNHEQLITKNQKEIFKDIITPKVEQTPLDLISHRIETALKEKKSDGARISYINCPINNVKQTAIQKKINIMRYWEVVNKKIRRENAPLSKNHKKLRLPPPDKIKLPKIPL
jgi:hypothetical protein